MGADKLTDTQFPLSFHKIGWKYPVHPKSPAKIWVNHRDREKPRKVSHLRNILALGGLTLEVPWDPGEGHGFTRSDEKTKCILTKVNRRVFVMIVIRFISPDQPRQPRAGRWRRRGPNLAPEFVEFSSALLRAPMWALVFSVPSMWSSLPLDPPSHRNLSCSWDEHHHHQLSSSISQTRLRRAPASLSPSGDRQRFFWPVQGSHKNREDISL